MWNYAGLALFLIWRLGDVMQNQIIKQLGKKLREKIPLVDELPPSIRMALERLSNAEKMRRDPCADTSGQN